MALVSCINCGNEFKVYGKRVKTAKFCSHDCQKKYHSKEENYTNWQEFTCENCNTKFKRKKGQVTSALNRGDTIRYCSRKCKMESETSGTKDVSCAECGKEIRLPKSAIDRAKNNFCSVECKNLYSAKERHLGFLTKQCVQCGKKFKVKVSDVNRFDGVRTFEYCSRECSNYHEKIIDKCSYCGKELSLTKYDFEASEKHYCNIDCMGKDRITSSEVACTYCGNTFLATPSRISYYNDLYCSNECRIRDFLSYGGYEADLVEFKTYQALSQKLRSCRDYRKWRKKILDIYDNTCQECGASTNLQVHHKKTPLYQICKENNFDFDRVLKDPRFLDLENGIVLCKKCHMNHHFTKSNGPSIE